MTFNNDVNQWTAIMNGLAPLQGIGCLSTLNYSYTNPISGTVVSTNSTTPGVHNVPDGNVFEMGLQKSHIPLLLIIMVMVLLRPMNRRHSLLI